MTTEKQMVFKILAPETPNDFEAYFELRWKVLREQWGLLPGTERDDQEATSIHRMILSPKGYPAAVGRLHYNSPQQAQVRFMAVHPDHQGGGFGSAILNELENIAKTENRVEIILQAREGAVRFYEKSGYTIREKSYLLFGSIQHYLMFKTLD